MKNTFCFILILLMFFSSVCCNWLPAEELSAVLEPSIVAEGEYFSLVLSSDSSSMPQLQTFPDKFVYLGSSEYRQIINGRHRNMVSYQFIAPKPGKYTIPPLKVMLGRKSVMTEELTLEVAAENEDSGLAISDLMVQTVLHPAGKTFYVNEEIVLEIKVLYPPSFNVKFSYPVVNIPNVLFRDFRAINSENPNFARPQRGRERIDGKIFDGVIFTTAFRALRAGSLDVKSVTTCQIEIPYSRKNEYNRTYRNYFRRINRELVSDDLKITVLPLPEVPEKGLFLGVVGSCNGIVELSSTQVKALEAVTLNIRLKSASALDTVRAPEFSLPDCRVYPGEIRRENGGCVISYVIIPLKSGPLMLDLDFLYFDPAVADYQALSIKKVLQVSPAAANSSRDASIEDFNVVNSSAISRGSSNPSGQTTLLYCKRSPSSGFSGAYRRNRGIISIILFALGGVIVLAAGLGSVIRKYRRKTPDELRRLAAGERRRELFIRLKKASTTELIDIASGDLADFLSDRWKLPPGSTVENVAEKAYDEDLAEALRECASVSYLPEKFAESALKDVEKIRMILLKSVKILIISLGFFILLSGMESVAGEGNTVSTPRSWEEALQCYDHGEYDQAKAYFEKYDRENGFDPDVYYNLGCIAAANGEVEMALYYMECAGLAAPGDDSIFENRNVLRRKMFWPEIGRGESPLNLIVALRDRIHPEDYLLLAAVVWCLGCICVVVSRRWRNSWRWSTGLIFGGFILLCLIAIFSQYSSTYRSGQALVITKNAPVYTFPGQHNGMQCAILHGGTSVQIVEKQTGYYLVRSGDQEGWIPEADVKVLTE